MTPSLLPLPISPRALQGLIQQAAALLPLNMDTIDARCMVTAICLQESGLAARRQFGNGPAKGLAQFERGGGVKGVMTHSTSHDHALRICQDRGIPFNTKDVWDALEFDDVLALAFARLLLYTDAKRLPEADPASVDDAWAYYERNWQPGKPHPEKWPGNWALALAAVNTSEK